MDEVLRLVEPKVMRAFVSYWGIEEVRSRNPQFTKYNVGHFIKNHTDDGAAFPHRVGSAVTYLSDDYEGGEIVFPKFNLKFKPSTGTTLLFPSEYVHAVAPVVSGTKSVFLFFVEVDR
ncbi:2OG-Fe(II) oxygenase [Burkholderia pseudomallei]|uniref:2OG-Fe(II) oxygenase n=1 Tax=Burkholderia pseudomallei TaxID=28450 RepID=UPI001603000C|nr:2OG-Fe(II) oxygenase [Burkholderia pseudomallei]